MPLIFEQTKDRNGKPSWFIYPHDMTGIHMGRIAWVDTGYALRPPEPKACFYVAAQLREIAEFIESVKVVS